MKKLKLISLVLVGTITTGVVMPTLTANATTLRNSSKIEERSNSNLSQEQLNELNEWMDSLKNDFKSENEKEEHSQIQARGPASLIVVKAGKWLRKHWNKVVSKAPSWLKPYLGASFAFKLLDKYMQISDTIDGLVWSVLRDLIPRWVPDPIVGGLKNVIVTIIPI